MAKIASGQMFQEPKEGHAPLHRKLSFNLNPEMVQILSPRLMKAVSNHEKNDIGKFHLHHEESKRNSANLSPDGNNKRLKAHKPDFTSIVSRFQHQKSIEDDHQSVEKANEVVLEKKGSKSVLFSKRHANQPLTSLLSKLTEKDKEHSSLEIAPVPITRDIPLDSDNQHEEKLRRNIKSPTMKVLKAFYPKARTFVRDKKEENTDDSRFDRDAVEDLDRWDNDHKQSMSNA